ncbi:hypothetical protein [Streptomyces resistomycificus]|uniref:Lipoprotein n=1 Tax=Streptomyces resistomycificus TaxID=67356 RepID=A0A0L8KRU1_9ACTN|nr:hypothetical protein [Streptomyces resistomycificus]KOG28653.1 lipoprotein [Streptomyces resistomycificus]KUN95970.1 hypothetical protein AQJ84_20860 [Streptomyces resistomycificus]
MRRTALAALCLAAAATTALTGCLPGDNKADSKQDTSARSSKPSTPNSPKGPFPGLTGGEIAVRAIDATASASSLRMAGDIPDAESGGTLGIDMALNKQGECAGTMSVGGQGEARLVHTGDTLYMKYDEAFLRAQSEGEPKADTDAAVELLAGKWTKMSAKGSDAKDIASFCDLDTVLGDAEDGHSNATRGKTTTVDGTPAIVLHEKDGKDRYTLYVATEGEPYVLRIDSSSAEDPGTVTFGDYGKPVPVRMPAGEVLDLDELG